MTTSACKFICLYSASSLMTWPFSLRFLFLRATRVYCVWREKKEGEGEGGCGCGEGKFVTLENSGTYTGFSLFQIPDTRVDWRKCCCRYARVNVCFLICIHTLYLPIRLQVKVWWTEWNPNRGQKYPVEVGAKVLKNLSLMNISNYR